MADADLAKFVVTVPTDPIAAVAAAVIAVCRLAESVIASQPPDVRAELWRMHVEDLRAWRAFWQQTGAPGADDAAILREARP